MNGVISTFSSSRHALTYPATVRTWICCGDWRLAPIAALNQSPVANSNGTKTPPAPLSRLPGEREKLSPFDSTGLRLSIESLGLPLYTSSLLSTALTLLTAPTKRTRHFGTVTSQVGLTSSQQLPSAMWQQCRQVASSCSRHTTRIQARPDTWQPGSPPELLAADCCPPPE